MPRTIHPTAIIDPRAEIGEDVLIGPYCIVEGDVVIGDGTQVLSHAFIGTGARIGKRCIIHHSAVVSNVPQDLKFKGTEKTYVELGDDCTVREFVTLHRATEHSFETNAGTLDGVTRIGSGCLIMAYTHIAHDCLIGDGVILANSVQLAGHVTVEKWCNIGGGVLVHQFSKIGTIAMVGGGAEVRKDIPPYALVGGGDAKVSGINRVGMQRRGVAPEAISAVKEAYYMLYQSGLNTSDGIAKIAASTEGAFPEVQHMLDFVQNSKRGIVGSA